MIDWTKLKFPNADPTPNELHSILNNFLQEGLREADAEEQKRRQLILKRVELNRHNRNAMMAIIQLEIERDIEQLRQLCWKTPFRHVSDRATERRRFNRRRKA